MNVIVNINIIFFNFSRRLIPLLTELCNAYVKEKQSFVIVSTEEPLTVMEKINSVVKIPKNITIVARKGYAWQKSLQDRINLEKAKQIVKAFNEARKKDPNVGVILVDGNQFKQYKKLRHECVIKGDNKYQNIAAASILAKNYRDKLMHDLSSSFDKYSWETNFGYPTKKHRESIKEYGVTEYHRKSFKLL